MGVQVRQGGRDGGVSGGDAFAGGLWGGRGKGPELRKGLLGLEPGAGEGKWEGLAAVPRKGRGQVAGRCLVGLRTGRVGVHGHRGVVCRGDVGEVCSADLGVTVGTWRAGCLAFGRNGLEVEDARRPSQAEGPRVCVGVYVGHGAGGGCSCRCGCGRACAWHGEDRFVALGRCRV